MSRRLRDEGGFTLVELLLVTVLFIIVLTATLTSFDGFRSNNDQAQRTIDQVEKARNGLEHFARQARNLGRQVSAETIAVAAPNDVVFQTSDPTRTWVRYCLDTTAGPAEGILWHAQRAGNLSAGMTGACPGTGWDQRTRVAEGVINIAEKRSLFGFICAHGGAGCENAPATFERITALQADLLIDLEPTRPPRAMRVTSSVYLRNQNEAPTANFSWRPLGKQKILLNGGASSDPEGRTLRYFWFQSSAAAFTCTTVPAANDGTWQTGVTLTWTFTQTPGTTLPFTLLVCDPGDRGASMTQTTTVPNG